MRFSEIATGALLFGIVCALPAEPVVKRSNCHGGTCDDLSKRTNRPGRCNADNVLRNLRDKRYSSSASAFCSTYIQSTTTDTIKTAAVTTQTEVFTPETVTVTSTELKILQNTFVKRDPQVYPTWLPASYPASRVSSACSCFVTPSAPVTVTTIITTGTDTVFTTTTAPTPTSTVVVEKPGYCAVPGCRTGTVIDSVSSVSTAGECIALCASTAGCINVQFGFDEFQNDKTFYCNLLSLPIADVYASGTSTDEYCANYQFFDVHCPV